MDVQKNKPRLRDFYATLSMPHGRIDLRHSIDDICNLQLSLKYFLASHSSHFVSIIWELETSPVHQLQTLPAARPALNYELVSSVRQTEYCTAKRVFCCGLLSFLFGEEEASRARMSHITSGERERDIRISSYVLLLLLLLPRRGAASAEI